MSKFSLLLLIGSDKLIFELIPGKVERIIWTRNERREEGREGRKNRGKNTARDRKQKEGSP
jgi:hypothetical protein